MGGVHRVTEMVPWQESWSETFETEKKQITDAVAAAGLSGTVHHVGSTSVKGMISKPIIDILLCPSKDAQIEAFLPVLENIGYENLGECGRPGRFFLSKGDEPNKTFYLHLCREDHQVAIDQMLFQYIEQSDPTVFYTYMKLKESLAILCPMDRDVYRTVKGRYVEGVLAAYRLGERTTAERVSAELLPEDEERIKYWIYEFEMPMKVRRELEAICAQHELTPDEFFENAVLDAIEKAKADREGERKKLMESDNDPELAQIHLVRYYPVYKGETEAQAYRRKLTEEAASKNGSKKSEAEDLSGV